MNPLNQVIDKLYSINPTIAQIVNNPRFRKMESVQKLIERSSAPTCAGGTKPFKGTELETCKSYNGKQVCCQETDEWLVDLAAVFLSIVGEEEGCTTQYYADHAVAGTCQFSGSSYSNCYCLPLDTVQPGASGYGCIPTGGDCVAVLENSTYACTSLSGTKYSDCVLDIGSSGSSSSGNSSGAGVSLCSYYGSHLPNAAEECSVSFKNLALDLGCYQICTPMTTSTTTRKELLKEAAVTQSPTPQGADFALCESYCISLLKPCFQPIADKTKCSVNSCSSAFAGSDANGECWNGHTMTKAAAGVVVPSFAMATLFSFFLTFFAF